MVTAICQSPGTTPGSSRKMRSGLDEIETSGVPAGAVSVISTRVLLPSGATTIFRIFEESGGVCVQAADVNASTIPKFRKYLTPLLHSLRDKAEARQLP